MSGNQKGTDFYEDKSVDETIEQLKADNKEGLSQKEIEERQQQYGKNTIEEEGSHPLRDFFKHFWGPIPWMLEVAVILSAIAQRWEDFAVILVMLMINGGVSYWHESKAQNAIQALKEKLSPKATIVREGEQKEIDAQDLVPGDLVIIKMGDIVPADAKILPDQHASIDESSLTGESLPVDKEENEMVYSGTSVKRGEAKAVVVAIGRHTKFAKTVELVEEADEKSHFQKAVLRIGYFLIGATALLVLTVVIVGWIRGDDVTNLLIFALVLTIAGIPQALPAVLSVTMTIGANRLAKMKAIVSNLSSMEEIAGLEVLCADKTGTLTKNELELQDPIVMDAKDAHDLVEAAALTVKQNGGPPEDPIDKAIMDALEDQGAMDKYEIKEFRPFDPTRKRAEAEVSLEGSTMTVAKGAPQVILDLVGANKETRDEISQKVDELGEKGFRALGVARQQDGKWSYLGILPLLDPPREDSKEVLEQAQQHGIDIRMVTGDHAAIGRQVAGQVGLKQSTVEAAEFFPEEREDAEIQEDGELNKKFLETDVFAQVTPEHKFRIIKQFQHDDRIVGMTGDGVNDAPALKQADVGFSVSGATDAARSASDLVLTAPGLGVITHAVEEARRIFERMISYATFRITETMRVLMFMSIAILAFEFYPVTPIMIVLLAILNDIPVMTIAYDNASTPSKPVRWDMKRVLSLATILGIGGVISSFILFWYVQEQMGLPKEEIQTIIFLKLLIAGHLTLFITRNSRALWKKPYPSLKFFLTLEGTQVLGTLFAVYGWFIHPIGWEKALSIWVYAIVWILILDQVKLLFTKFTRS